MGQFCYVNLHIHVRYSSAHVGFPLSLNLDPSGDFYTLGSESHDHTLHTLSFTLSNAQHLPSHPSNQIYFYYNLLGNDITSELFTPPLFSPECASIRIKSSRQLLALLFAAQKDVEVHACSCCAEEWGESAWERVGEAWGY